MKKIQIKAKYVRRYPDPCFKGAEHLIVVAPANAIPTGIELDPNPRDQNLKTRVTERIEESLLDQGEKNFHLKNRGITLLAEGATFKEDRQEVEVELVEGQGIADGGHTYKIICKHLAEIDDDKFVNIHILTGVPVAQYMEMVDGLNTSNAVKSMSLLNNRDYFDWMKKCLEGHDYYKAIGWRENTPSEEDVKTLVGIANLFNIDLYKDSKSVPINSYSSKEKVLELYGNEIDKAKESGLTSSFEKLAKILPDILELHDFIQVEASDVYNTGEGKYGHLAFVKRKGEKAKTKTFKLLFTGAEIAYPMFDGALYPLLGAFRFLVQQKPGEQYYSWKIPFKEVKALFSGQDGIGRQLLESVRDRCKSLGYNPQSLGKDKDLWVALYKDLAMKQQGIEI